MNSKKLSYGDVVEREGYDPRAYRYMVTNIELGFGDETAIVDVESGKERVVKTSTLTLRERPTWTPIA